jgi:dynactin complex subunit
MNSGMSQEREKPKEIPVEVTVGKIIERLKTAVNLDELQVIAISNILTESIRSQGIIIKQENSQADKIKDMKALSEITDSKVMVLLNKDQKEKYLAYAEEMKNPKKSKADKKSKKESKKESEE